MVNFGIPEDAVSFIFVLFSPRGVNHPTYPSVLQSLDIEDPVVANCLIDQRGIESVLLIKVTSCWALCASQAPMLKTRPMLNNNK